VGPTLLQQEQRGAHHIIACRPIGPPEGLQRRKVRW
jgi:hypothetical protein